MRAFALIAVLLLSGCADVFQLDYQTPEELAAQKEYCLREHHTMYYHSTHKWPQRGYVTCPGGKDDIVNTIGDVQP